MKSVVNHNIMIKKIDKEFCVSLGLTIRSECCIKISLPQGKNKTKQKQLTKLVKTFTKFHNRSNDIIRKYKSTCRHLIRSSISHPIFFAKHQNFGIHLKS